MSCLVVVSARDSKYLNSNYFQRLLDWLKLVKGLKWTYSNKRSHGQKSPH